MAKGLKQAFAPTPEPTPPAANTGPVTTHQPAPRPPSRQGRTAMNIYVSREAHRQLRILALDERRSGQLLIVEALNLLFAKYDLPQIAD